MVLAEHEPDVKPAPRKGQVLAHCYCPLALGSASGRSIPPRRPAVPERPGLLDRLVLAASLLLADRAIPIIGPLGSIRRGSEMSLINTNGWVLIGPGSEWFWTAVSGLVLAVTFFAIYRQLRVQRSANAFTHLGALVDELQGERFIRKWIGVLVALRDGAAPVDLPDAPASAIANYWEKVGALVRAGHIDRSLIAEGLAGADEFWGILAPWVMRARAEDANPTLWENFEWLARTLVQLHPATAFDQQSFERTLERQIAGNEADLRDLVAMRT